jgi:uncharacterized protein (DUF1684 family)
MREGLELADYRRRVAEMYLAPPTGGAQGWAAFRAARERLFREHPQSALDPAARAGFTGLPYFDYDERYRVPARLADPPDGGELVIDTGGPDGAIRCRREALLVTPFGELTLFWIMGYGGGLFLPFRDGTAGRETYGGGRYLVDTIKGTFGRGLTVTGDEAVLDFNYAYNPSCCYDARYACPLAPRENWLDAPITAGEQTVWKIS